MAVMAHPIAVITMLLQHHNVNPKGGFMQLTDKQYEVLLQIYNEWEELWNALPLPIKVAFYERLYK